MKRTTLQKNMTTLLVILLVVFSCERAQDMRVGVVWMDDDHFENGSARYLGILEGEFDQETGFDNDLIDVIEISPGIDMTHSISLPTSGATNYTAFVFIDVNDNGTYEGGHDLISGYKYNCAEPGECLNISLSAFY